MKILAIFFAGSLIAQAALSQCTSPDGRLRSEIHTVSSPYHNIAQVVVHRKFLFFFKSNPISTVSFVSKNVLVGAGHTFRQKWYKTKITGFTIYIGKRKENGTISWITSRHFRKSDCNIFVHPIFQRKGDPDFDYSYVALPVNMTETFFALDKFENLPVSTDSVYITGYPGDKSGEELWQKGDKKENIAVDTSVLKYSIYTFTGDSGAPIWVKNNGTNYLIGIHNTGSYHGTRCNAGSRLTNERISELMQFIANNGH